MEKIVRLTETDLRRIVKRVVNENKFLGDKDNFINKIIKEINPPYIKDLKWMGIPKEYWEDIFSKIFNQKVDLELDSELNKLSVRDENGNKIYYENSQGFSKKYESVDDNEVIEYVKGIVNPSYPNPMKFRYDYYSVLKDPNGNETASNILLKFQDFDHGHGTEFNWGEEEEWGDFIEGNLLISEDFIVMVHNFNPNLSREKIVNIIKECFITEFDDAAPKVIKIYRVNVRRLPPVLIDPRYGS